MKTDTTVCVSLFDCLALAFHSKLDGYGREPRFVLAAGINPKMVAGKAEIDRRDILLCKLILSFSPVNHQWGLFWNLLVREDEESDEEEKEKDHSQICTKGKHFACDELYLSDESDDEFDCEPEKKKKKKIIAKSEDIKSQVSVAETEMLQEIETFRSAIARVEKYKETRKEVERKLDLQYQRKV
uniref:Uncharacterized protein n=1 Tax=Brassica oleracea var. oleracea TaxID=109376 RepID=A0A0D3D9M0_BRAOL